MNHPLFPAEDETDAPEVGAIHVTRHEGGSQRWAPRRFAAEDLRELSDIAELFGGGCYELIARSRDGSRITARRRYTLAGPPLPLDERDVPAPAPPAAAPLGGATDLVPMMLQWMQVQQQMASSRESTNTQLLLGMLTKSDTQSAAHVEAMASLHAGFAKSQSELFAQLAAMRMPRSEQGGTAAFIKGIEFAQEVSAGAAEARAEGEEDSTIKDLVEGLKAFSEIQKGSPPAGTGPNGGGGGES